MDMKSEDAFQMTQAKRKRYVAKLGKIKEEIIKMQEELCQPNPELDTDSDDDPMLQPPLLVTASCGKEGDMPSTLPLASAPLMATADDDETPKAI
jgi:hypothetical protein